MEIWKYLIALSVIILLIISGSKVVYNDRFVVITGTINMPEQNDSSLTGSTDIAYPDGFNNENCVVVSLMSHNTLHTDWWCTTTNTKNASAGIAGSGDLTARLKPTVITVSSNKVTVEEYRKDVTFKITLMKLPELKEGVDYILGDVDQNGIIEENDGDLLLKYIVGQVGLTEQQLKAADVNKDGKVEALDAAIIKRYATGQISSLD